MQINGHGSSLLQLSYHYYVLPDARAKSIPANINISERCTTNDELTSAIASQSTEALNSFIIAPLAKMSSPQTLEMEICFEFKPSDVLKYRKTNMVIMEVALPSGFVLNSEAIKDLRDEDSVSKIELKNKNTLIFIYFENLIAGTDDTCLGLKADLIHEVAMLKPSSITMYDFYNLHYRDIVFYGIEK